jgi:putative transposase
MMLAARGFGVPYNPSMTLFQDRYRVESARLVDWDYSSRGWYFVTLCTRNKECSLAHSVNGEIVLSDAGVIAEIEMKAISIHYSNVIIDRFVVMPNHVHTIVVIDGRHLHSPEHGVFPPTQTHHPSISAVIGGYKAGVTRRCHSQGIQDFWWQSRFHDRILRSNVSVNAVRDYIDRNPQNWLEDPNNPSTAARGDGASPVSTRG